MNSLAPLIFEPVPLRWSQLRTRLPRVIELPAAEGSADDHYGNELFKRIDLVTRDELQAHLQTRKNALLLEIQEMQLLGELYRSAVATGCAGDEPLFAAIERLSVTTPSPEVHSSQGAQ